VGLEVSFTDDAARAQREAEGFLGADPVRHNLVLTLLRARTEHPEPGRYWIVRQGGAAIAIALQTPPTFPALVSRMAGDCADDAVGALAHAIAGANVVLPGVHGDAATAARFAAEWAERRRTPAIPFQGMRLYALADNSPALPTGPSPSVASHAYASDSESAAPMARGRLRVAGNADRDLVLRWMRGFQEDTGERAFDADLVVERRLPSGHFFMWDDEGPASMVAGTAPLLGVVRVQFVYTPPERRRRGYGQACVGTFSAHLRSQGHRPVLYADLGNPTSNGMYRRIGYQPVVEVVKYRFEEAPRPP
jgi:GNAT superfamily N-acetyltransferase